MQCTAEAADSCKVVACMSILVVSGNHLVFAFVNAAFIQVLRQQHASQVTSLELRLKAAESHAASAEAAEVHAVQQQFADDCLQVRHV